MLASTSVRVFSQAPQAGVGLPEQNVEDSRSRHLLCGPSDTGTPNAGAFFVLPRCTAAPGFGGCLRLRGVCKMPT